MNVAMSLCIIAVDASVVSHGIFTDRIPSFFNGTTSMKKGSGDAPSGGFMSSHRTSERNTTVKSNRDCQALLKKFTIEENDTY